MPFEAQWVRLIDNLCQRWGSPPSVVLRENAADTLQMLAILADMDGDGQSDGDNEWGADW